jgi:lipopolysaccharide/colanic/teichoic acid biosynthesis glycosyltransferase
MNLVGPRPERPFFVELLKGKIPYYDLRHAVRPGLTGWAQVSFPYGASIEDVKRKLEYDLFYVKNASFAFDFAILAQTVRIVLLGKGR